MSCHDKEAPAFVVAQCRSAILLQNRTVRQAATTVTTVTTLQTRDTRACARVCVRACARERARVCSAYIDYVVAVVAVVAPIRSARIHSRFAATTLLRHSAFRAQCRSTHG